MSTIAETKKRSKKTKRLGPVRVIRPEQYEGFDVNSKLECIQALIPLGLMHIQELLEDEVRALAGIKYTRKATSGLLGYRHGSNPGSVQLAGQRHPCKIPRVQYVKGGGEIPLESLAYLRGTGQLDEVLLKRVLYGISCRNYEVAAAAVPGAIGLSSSTVSRRFTHASAKQLKGLQERDLSKLDILAIFLDGKTFAEMTMVVAVGVTLTGEKHVLGFVKTGTENEPVLTSFLRELEERGLTSSQGLLSSLMEEKACERPCGRPLGHQPWCSGASGTNGRMSSDICRKGSRPPGVDGSNERISVRPMRKPEPRSRVYRRNWRIATNRRRGVWRKAWRTR